MSDLPRRAASGALVLFALAALAEAQSPAERRPLPDKAPPVPVLEFQGPAAGYPPEPKNAKSDRILDWTFHPGALTDEIAARANEAAVADARVRPLLGERFAFIAVDEIDPPGKRPRRPEERLPLRVRFFSHSNNTAVVVFLTPELKVSRAARLAGPLREGREEVEAAAALARAHEGLRGRTEGLEVAGLVVEPRRGQPGAGNRVINVVFTKGDEDLPRYSGLVDLTAQKVLTAGETSKEVVR